MAPLPRAVNINELCHSTTHTRLAFTTVLNPTGAAKRKPDYDFLRLISLLCEICQSYGEKLIPMQPFHPNSELIEDGGHTCIVSRRAIATPTPSNMRRGHTESLEENIIVKRTRQGVLEPKSAAMVSFIAELRVRAHLPLRLHPNIANLKGIAWDFEDEKLKKPRPLLLEEFAEERSLARFWKEKSLMRMPFRAKAELCLDIAKGLAALHACGVVHGDVKPENILIFPRLGVQDAFIAKLTDFGHSVFAYENQSSLRAFTKQYCAPEAVNGNNLTFDDMKQTDVYSFGLVVLSVVIGRSFFPEFGEELDTIKKEGRMVDRAYQLVGKEDKENADSDFDLDLLKQLFQNMLNLDLTRRNLAYCVRVLEHYIRMQQQFPVAWRSEDSVVPFEPIKALDNNLYIGYQTIARCSHVVKQKIFESLKQLAADDSDPRSVSAAWELSICYFSGFGTDRSFTESSRYLAAAASKGVVAAQTYFLRLHNAMGLDPCQSLDAYRQNAGQTGTISNNSPQPDLNNVQGVISGWLYQSALLGCEEILPDFEAFDSERYQIVRQDIMVSVRVKSEVGEDYDPLLDASTWLVPGDQVSPIQSASRKELAIAATSGDLLALRNALQHDAKAVNYQDDDGNTALIHAARCCQYEALKLLVDLPEANAGIFNRGQQNALHFLHHFKEQQLLELVPRLVQRHASITQEASFVIRAMEVPDITPRIRSCPVLRAILNNNNQLLRALLNAAHISEISNTCRICEAGSRYRRIMAIAISLHRADAVEILLKHLTEHNTGGDTDLQNIEVWYYQELLPVWSLAIKAPPAGSTDLPEPFFRALHYGKSYQDALQKTLRLLWKPRREFLPVAYEQLQEAVLAQNVEAIDFLTDEAKRRGLSAGTWWWITANLHENPLLLSIRSGFRSTFQRLVELHPETLNNFLFQLCCIDKCSECRKPFDYSLIGGILAWLFHMRKKKHKINLAQILLSLSAASAHQDLYFISFLLKHTTKDKIPLPQTPFDERFSQQPTSFLAQAILAHFFSAADEMLVMYPDLLETQMVLIVPTYLRSNQSGSYITASQSWLLSYDSQPIPESLPLILYTLLVGSYPSCAYVFRRLQNKRNRLSLPGLALFRSCQRMTDPEERGCSTLSSLVLKESEYHYLLLGLIKDDREDRYPLWEVVTSQVYRGHSTDWYYIRVALFYANNRALTELIRRGWSVHGPIWAYLFPPIILAQRIARSKEYLLPDRNIAFRKSRGPEFGFKSPAYHSFCDTFDRQFMRQTSMIEENIRTLEQRGAQVPWVTRKARVLFWPSYFLFYLLILPLSLSYSVRVRNQTLHASIGWYYCYAAIAALFPPLPVLLWTPILYHRPRCSRYTWVVRYFILPTMWLANHLVIPIAYKKLGANLQIVFVFLGEITLLLTIVPYVM